MTKNWHVYVVRCADGTLYTGTSTDVPKRIVTHNSGKGAKYTRVRRPVVLVFDANGMSKSEALIRECAIKAMSKQEKEHFIVNA